MKPTRIHSIDVLRALTMVLMIWVNDFWTLQGIPGWLQHMPAEVDALGFSDVIFPAFLFIVGLSIPFALQNRRDRGDSNGAILRHIAERSIALLVMGLYMVNLESYSAEASGMSKALWQVLMILGFVLIWNVYPRGKLHPAVQRALKLAGIAILVGLAVVFRSTSEGYNWLEPHWWGILGLIGWAYLLCAVAQLYLGHSLLAVAAAWVFFMIFNIAHFAGWLSFLSPMENYLWIAGNGAMPAFTMAGCLVSTLYRQRFSADTSGNRFVLLLLVMGLLTLAAGFLLRPAWGISKIQATPAWTEICTGLGILSFAFFYWLVDLKGINPWPRFLLPAGVATLTCYLVPYWVYPAFALLPFTLPAALTTGMTGLGKSMLFAVFVVILTGGLNRLGVKLNI